MVGLVMALLGTACFLSGIYFLLRAVWRLRIGDDEREFLRFAFIGMLLCVLPWLFLWMGALTAFVRGPVRMGLGG
ncbi:hypothetical protein [Alicyclobacillus macrosporangiidus]|uniref:hypothetical protein n=1 Tax=Alicyclobacillus macrosporangiidus TaxID=392015 RepID=UPI000496508A|nr:hypothetical protein [Alicyclobacillus macrosporangiidus]